MKTNNVFGKLACLFVFSALVACSEDAIVEKIDGNGILQRVSITGKDFLFDDATRSSVSIGESGATFTWSENDTVGIFPNKGSQAEFAMSEGVGTQTATFSGGGWALKSSATYSAYYPYNFYNRDMTKIPVSYVGQTQNGNNNTDHIGAYDFMAASVATPSNGAVAFDMQHLGCLVQFKITVPEAGTELKSIALSAEEGNFVLEGNIDLSAKSPSIKWTHGSSTITLSLNNAITVKDSETILAYMMLLPNFSESKYTIDIYYDTKTASNKHQAFSFPNKKLKPGNAYSFSMEMGSLYYRDVTIEKAGMLKSILSEDTATIQTLKIVGPINGDDIRLLRNMAGVDVLNQETDGQLRVLDLSDAVIVEGGGYYATREKWTSTGEDYYLYAKNNIFGPFMFSYSKLSEIKLPATITEIGDLALFDCNSLTKLTVPETVSAIREAAFMHCDNITEIILPDNLSVLAESVFRACLSLKGIPSWPSKITKIPFGTFAACKSFVNISIPNNVTEIGGSAFWDCEALQRIDVPATVTKISDYAFQNCNSLKILVCYPTTPPTLGQEIFYGVARVPELYTPYDSRDSYKYANGWYNYYKNLGINAIEWGIE